MSLVLLRGGELGTHDGSLVKIISHSNVEARSSQTLLALLDLVALKANYNGHLDLGSLRQRRHHSLGNRQARCNTTKNVHQDRLDILVVRQDFKRLPDLLGRHSASNIQKVGR